MEGRKLLPVLIWVLAASLAFLGNAHAARKRQAPAASWPSGSEAVFAYIYTLRNQADAGVTDEKNALRRFLTKAKDPTLDLVLDKPVALAARSGRVLVADLQKKLVVVFDIPRRRVYPFGVRDDPGKLQKPISVALDKRGRAYVLDAETRKVNVYDDMGLYLHSIGDMAALERPVDVAIDQESGNIVVVDRSSEEKGRPRVISFDPAGRMRFAIEKAGPGPGELNIPIRAAVDAQGRIYVLDSGNFRVQVFDSDGKFLHAFGAAGSVSGTFARPRGLAVSDYVFVGDAEFGNVQVFDKSGRLLLIIGTKTKNFEDTYAGEYALISGLAVDELGQLYIADQFLRKVEIIRPTGYIPITDSPDARN